MKRNIRKKLKDTKGITLVALVVTIIVLLILAGVALSSVLSQDGIFHRAEQATDKYGQEKARETLELALGEAQMQKYEQGLTDEQLTEKINEIGEELEERETIDISQAIVEGYIFSIDRTVPKILDYIGPADGVIITAVVNGNKNGWLSSEEITNITVTGTIKTYSGGTITTVSAKKGETVIEDFTIDTNGRYTISNITADATIVISAEDTNGKSSTKMVPITIKVDNKAPTVELNAVVEDVPYTGKMKIKFNAIATDNESGIKQLSYTITSTEDKTLVGIPENQRTGMFTNGQIVEIVALPIEDKDEIKYKISVTAVDNAGNESNSKETEVTTICGLTIAEIKELVNADTLRQYIGKRVIDYVPQAGGKWRVFYCEDSINYFGDGEGTIYLKRDYDLDLKISLNTEKVTSDGIKMMKKLNPLLNKESNLNMEGLGIKATVWLCDSNNWKNYCDDKVARYAVGGMSLEMLQESYSIFMYDKRHNNFMKLETAEYGYWPHNRDDWSGHGTSIYISSGPFGIFGTDKNPVHALCSPSNCSTTNEMASVMGAAYGQIFWYRFSDIVTACPIVSLK